MATPMTATKQKKHGFTLIEILIVIAIVGILAAIAIPSYTQYMTQTRRLDAKAFLQEVAGEQVRFFSDNNRFATTMTELGYGEEDTQDSPDGHYTISIANLVPTSFTLTATVVSTGQQASDDKCGNLTLDSTGLKGATGTLGVDGCW